MAMFGTVVQVCTNYLYHRISVLCVCVCVGGGGGVAREDR